MRAIVALDLSRDADFRRWQGYVLAHPDAQYSDLGEWRRIFGELYGLRSVNFACVDDERTCGVASLYLVASPFFGRMLVSCPFFGSGGLYADDPQVEDALLERVHAAAREHDVDWVEFRLRRALRAPYEVRCDFADFELALDGTAESVWHGALASSARQNVRKSRAWPLAFSTTHDPEPAYGLLSRTIRDLGTPFHSRRLFELLVEHLGESVRFSEVRLGGRLVGAGVLVRFRDRLSTPFIGSLRRYGSTRANYCQYWGIIQHALETGVRRFDLGRSPLGSSHQRFKEKWGAVPVALHYAHRGFSARRPYRTVLEAGRVERLASAAWKRLPLGLARGAGHWIARHIP